MLIRKAYRLKLYPNRRQAASIVQHCGACRWLWNFLLALQKDHYAQTGRFVFYHDMSKMLPGIKRQFPWLAEAPSGSLQRVCRNLDAALKKCSRGGGGFPRFKAKGRSRDAFYVVNQCLTIDEDARRVILPKTAGSVRFRTGRLPEGKIIGANVSWNGKSWALSVQCEVEREIVQAAPSIDTVLACDLGTNDLMVRSDGVRVKAPKRLRSALKKLKRAQRILFRRKNGSRNRARQARLVGRIYANIRDQRRDVQHKATSSIVRGASAVVTENLSLKGMVRNRHLALSLHDAGLGEMLRQIAYKCEWSGVAHITADRFYPSTQTCSSCGTVKTGGQKLSLRQRTYQCVSCGHEMDRDLNAALNLRRLGIHALGLNEDYVGQAMPERAAEVTLPANACGDSSARPGAFASGRYGSTKQEPSRTSIH